MPVLAKYHGSQELQKKKENMFSKESLTIKDAFFLNRTKSSGKKISDRQKESFERSQKLVIKRTTLRPANIAFPETLPISQVKDEIIEKIKANQVIILCGETGSGKTTQLPKILYSLGYGIRGRIGCTQPRRLATVSMAKRVSDELNGCTIGKQVGYKVRFDEKICKETSIKFMTDGILLAETTSDRNLLEYDAIIIDEAHERSLNIDFILGYIKRLTKRRPNLKIIISSATLDADKFAIFFDNAPVINVKGRHFPVDVFHLPEHNDNEELGHHILRAIDMLRDTADDGDILVFLPGEREIRDAANLLKGQKWKSTEILPLYARLTLGEQQKIFTVGKYRRIILSTNVAETSLTIPGIHYVIDSGLVRMKRYNPRTQIESLQIEQISKAAAKQRQGRCGRIAAGVCIRLYDEVIYEESEDFTPPEILRTSLADVILHMKMIRLPDIEVFPFVDAPKRNQVREGLKTLFEIGALDKSNELTSLGRTIGRFSIDPRLARMLVEGNNLNTFTEISCLVAILSIQDPRDFPIDKQEEIKIAHRQWLDDRSDFLFYLHLRSTLNEMRQQNTSNSAIRRFCKKNFLNYMRIREWENLQNDLRNTARELKWKNINEPLDISKMHYDHLHRCIITGVPMQIGVKSDDNKGYIGTGNKAFFLFPGSALFGQSPKWLITFNLVETSKLYARTAAKIDPELIEQAVPHLCKTIYSNPTWDENRGFVSAEKKSSLGGLSITQKQQVYYGKIDPQESRKIFITDGLIPANIKLKGKWLKQYQKVLANIKNKEIKIRRPQSGVDFNKAYDVFDGSIPEDINSGGDLDRWTYKHRNALQINEDDISTPLIKNVEADFPDFLCKGNDKFKLEYAYSPTKDSDGVTIYIPANRLFMVTTQDQDWLVKGWIEQKTLLVLKTLLKQIKMQLNPLSNRAKEFAEFIEQSTGHKDKSFLEVLVSYIRDEFDIYIGKDDMNTQNLPIWFVPRIAVINSKKEIISMTRELENIEKTIPEKELLKTKNQKLLSGFPKTTILPKDILNGKIVYNALKKEKNNYIIEHYVDKSEADAEFYSTIATMFREYCPKQIQFLEKKLPLDIQTRLTIGAMNSQHLEDFIDSAIYLAFDKVGEFPYSKNMFEESAEKARGELYECGQELAAKLSTVVNAHSEVIDALNKIKNNNELTQDIEMQLSEIFYCGFLLKPENMMDIIRWLNGIKLRIDRASYDPQKDMQKQNNILPYRQQIHELLAKKTDKQHISPKIVNILIMFQEFRVSIFAPEVGRRIKISEKKMRKLMEK